jgi:hypothetical protein
MIRRACSEDVSLTPKNDQERVVPLLPGLETRVHEAIRNKLPKAHLTLEPMKNRSLIALRGILQHQRQARTARDFCRDKAGTSGDVAADVRIVEAATLGPLLAVGGSQMP